MAKQIDFIQGTVVTPDFLDDTQEVDSAAAWGVRVIKSGANVVTIPTAADGTSTGQSSIVINGLPRYITSSAAVTRSFSSPADAAGTYGVYLTAGTGPGFVMTVTQAAAPANSRKIAEVDWDGTANVTAVRNMVDAVAGHNFLHSQGQSDELPLATYDPATMGSIVLTRTGAAAITIGSAGSVNLYRSAADVLKTDDYFHAGQGIKSRAGTQYEVFLDSIGADPGIIFGNAGDTNLYRSAADVLQTDDTFNAVGNIRSNFGLAGQVNINPGPGGTGGLSFGLAGDTNLYRGAPQVLASDHHIRIAQNLRAREGGPARITLGDVGPGGASGIFFGSADDLSLYRSADATLHFGGSDPRASFPVLTVGGTGPATFNFQGGNNGTYTAEGVWNVNAQPSAFRGPGSARLLFGYDDNGAGAYVPSLGWSATRNATNTEANIGPRFIAQTRINRTDDQALRPIDTANRFQIAFDGAHSWGPGTAAVDVNLYRSTANTLRTNGSFVADGNVSISGSNLTVQPSASNPAVLSLMGATAAQIDMRDADHATADARRSRLLNNAGTTNIEAINDAYSAVTKIGLSFDHTSGVVAFPNGVSHTRSGASSTVPRMVRGAVRLDGTVDVGTGFTSSLIATGHYRVTWSTAFSAAPIVTVSPVDRAVFSVSSSAASCDFFFFDGATLAGEQMNVPFVFIAASVE